MARWTQITTPGGDTTTIIGGGGAAEVTEQLRAGQTVSQVAAGQAAKGASVQVGREPVAAPSKRYTVSGVEVSKREYAMRRGAVAEKWGEQFLSQAVRKATPRTAGEVLEKARAMAVKEGIPEEIAIRKVALKDPEARKVEKELKRIKSVTFSVPEERVPKRVEPGIMPLVAAVPTVERVPTRVPIHKEMWREQVIEPYRFFEARVAPITRKAIPYVERRIEVKKAVLPYLPKRVRPAVEFITEVEKEAYIEILEKPVKAVTIGLAAYAAPFAIAPITKGIGIAVRPLAKIPALARVGKVVSPAVKWGLPTAYVGVKGVEIKFALPEERPRIIGRAISEIAPLAIGGYLGAKHVATTEARAAILSSAKKELTPKQFALFERRLQTAIKLRTISPKVENIRFGKAKSWSGVRMPKKAVPIVSKYTSTRLAQKGGLVYGTAGQQTQMRAQIDIHDIDIGVRNPKVEARHLAAQLKAGTVKDVKVVGSKVLIKGGKLIEFHDISRVTAFPYYGGTVKTPRGTPVIKLTEQLSRKLVRGSEKDWLPIQKGFRDIFATAKEQAAVGFFKTHKQRQIAALESMFYGHKPKKVPKPPKRVPIIKRKPTPIVDLKGIMKPTKEMKFIIKPTKVIYPTYKPYKPTIPTVPYALYKPYKPVKVTPPVPYKPYKPPKVKYPEMGIVKPLKVPYPKRRVPPRIVRYPPARPPKRPPVLVPYLMPYKPAPPTPAPPYLVYPPAKPPKRPPVLVPLLKEFKYKPKRKIIKRRLRRPYRYTPTLFGIEFEKRIIGKIPKAERIWTGVEVRPVITPKRFKRLRVKV